MSKKSATMKREPHYPFYWFLIEKNTGIIIDRDKYQSDLKERWEDEYTIFKIGDMLGIEIKSLDA